MAIEQANDMASAHAHAVGQMIDDFVIHNGQVQRIAQTLRDFIAQ
jgi:hypothetical protein